VGVKLKEEEAEKTLARKSALKTPLARVSEASSSKSKIMR